MLSNIPPSRVLIVVYHRCLEAEEGETQELDNCTCKKKTSVSLTVEGDEEGLFESTPLRNRTSKDYVKTVEETRETTAMTVQTGIAMSAPATSEGQEIKRSMMNESAVSNTERKELPSRVMSIRSKSQHRVPTPICTPSSPSPQRYTRASSPQTLNHIPETPAVYSLRPVIPAHLSDKTVADPSIQLELDYLRAKSYAARGRSVLERAQIFGGAGGNNKSGEEEQSGKATPGGYWRETPKVLMKGNGKGDEENDNEGTKPDESAQGKISSLRAMAIMHRFRSVKASPTESLHG